jgi:choline dehydrogenase-like flavoprotein
VLTVGAGAAGNVLAHRLTENAGTEVLLLESGDDDAKNPSVHIPMSAQDLQQSGFDYSYKTVPQERAAGGMIDRVCAKLCIIIMETYALVLESRDYCC